MIWLVAFSLSPTHGSEAAVGWQWYERLSRVAPVQVIAHQMYDQLGWVPEPLRSQIHWIDTKPTVVADVNKRRHLFAFWRQARALLRCKAQSGDRVVIATQAAIWFLPWGRLPVPRQQVFYGPIGPELLRGDPGFRTRDHIQRLLRNTATLGFAVAWRLGAAWLPGRISLRFAAPWPRRLMGDGFCFDAVLPEVEPPAGAAPSGLASTAQPRIIVLYDNRSRKNFSGSLAYALTLAAARKVALVLVGVPQDRQPAISALAGNAGVTLEFHSRTEREAFRALLADRPALVSLSLSEGVPSTLYEALIAGCELHIYEVGGLTWLLHCAENAARADVGGRSVVVFRWTAESSTVFAAASRREFDGLVKAILDG